MNKSVCNSKENLNRDKCRCKCKDLDDWRSCEKGYIWNSSICDCKCNKACKIYEYLDIKNCSCEKRLIGKLVLECQDEMLNTTETSHDDKNVACSRNNCLFHTISLVLICLLLSVVICVTCYSY